RANRAGWRALCLWAIVLRDLRRPAGGAKRGPCASVASLNVLVGTSGYSYKEWKGRFYPAGLKEAGMLRFYAERFPTVEINNTFYRMPSPELLARWEGEVPDGFRFILKAPRRITHEKRLHDVADTVARLLEVSAGLGGKRGPFLFQLPPYFKKDAARLRDFLQLLPLGVRAAFEFRDP